MGMTQLECGMSVPFFSLPATPWVSLVTPTWITHLWSECSEKGIGVRFHSHTFWVPKATREKDTCIMAVAATMYQGAELQQINLCPISLRVTFLSDIATGGGKRIILAYYDGKEHRESGRQARLSWPPVGPLPKQWWNLWQTFLQRWCGTALRIPEPLGRWYPGAEILTRCCCFLYERRLIMQHQVDWLEFAPFNATARTRFTIDAFPFNDLHLLPHTKVVDITYKHRSIYIISQSEQNFLPTPDTTQGTQFHDLYHELSPELQRIIGKVEWPPLHELINIAQSLQDGTAQGVSDGSVRTVESRASQAWIIQASNGSEIRGMGPVDSDSSTCTSHRAELQGQAALFLMLSLFLQYFQLVGVKIATFCDNQPVVKKV